MKYHFLVFGLLFASPVVLHAAETKSAKPNIVLIFIDDMGYADISPFGNTEVRTPHLDRLAAEGMKFMSFYATPVCTMSRACLLTGCYNARISMPGVLFPHHTSGLNPDEITLAEVVKPKGYATCAIGKWHLGHYPEFLPTRQGFDHYFGLPYSNDMRAGRNGMPPLPLYRDETVIETEPDQSQLTRRYTEEAVKFIHDHREHSFFVYLPHTMIHGPLAASEAFVGKSKLGLLGDAIEEIDWSVGQIMATLKEHRLDENTLVIFTSDNGPAGSRTAPPFRGNKGTNFEGGVREPCIMRWPGKIPAGTSCSQIAGNIDLLPTLAKLVGTELPHDRIIDGRDITSLMLDPQAGPVRDTHLYFDGSGKLQAVRQGDWKLFVGQSVTKGKGNKNNKKSKDEALKKKAKSAGSGALYHLVDDPGESSNVAAEHPEVVARLVVAAERSATEINEHKRPVGQHLQAQ